MATIKIEPNESLDQVKKEILDLIQAYDNGLSEKELSRTMSSTSGQLRVDAINALTNEGRIQLFKQGSELIYRSVDAKTFSNHSTVINLNISLEERIIYQAIETAGNKGIWNREIRNKTQVPLKQMSKVLKNLETKKLIKAVKSVTASKKKLYMLYGLEPDKSVTGGAWYSGTEFESEYVQILHEQCYQFVKRRLQSSEVPSDFVESRNLTLVSSSEVKDYIDKLKISNVILTLQDIEMVLETIVYDGLIEKIAVVKKPDLTIPIVADKVLTSDDEESEVGHVTYYYRALSKLVESSGIMRVPCGQCPYIHECRPAAVINPSMCLYLERWFSK